MLYSLKKTYPFQGINIDPIEVLLFIWETMKFYLSFLDCLA